VKGALFMSNKIKILIADDHPIVRQGLRQTIESEGGELEIVGKRATGRRRLPRRVSLVPQ